MTENDQLAQRFEHARPSLKAVAYRILGSHTDAEDAVQEAWIRLSRTGTQDIDNLDAWLTTVTGRICLNQLRTRAARPEDPVGVHLPDPIIEPEPTAGPEQQALESDEISLALMIVLDSLTPAERVAFVLHDLFHLTFDEIAPVVSRSAVATRQLASRARRRVQAARTDEPTADLTTRRLLVDAFFAAARTGDLDALVAALDPDVILRADGGTLLAPATAEVRGAKNVAKRAMLFDRPGAAVHAVLVNGTPGALVTQDGRPVSVMGFTIADDRIRHIQILLDPTRLSTLDLLGRT